MHKYAYIHVCVFVCEYVCINVYLEMYEVMEELFYQEEEISRDDKKGEERRVEVRRNERN